MTEQPTSDCKLEEQPSLAPATGYAAASKLPEAIRDLGVVRVNIWPSNERHTVQLILSIKEAQELKRRLIVALRHNAPR